jgi:hypothetical protein
MSVSLDGFIETPTWLTDRPRRSTPSSFFENTILGISRQMRANSSIGATIAATLMRAGLVETRVFGSGVVYLRYEAVGGGG